MGRKRTNVKDEKSLVLVLCCGTMIAQRCDKEEYKGFLDTFLFKGEVQRNEEI